MSSSAREASSLLVAPRRKPGRIHEHPQDDCPDQNGPDGAKEVKLNPTNLARHELIGLNVQVESNNEPREGIIGLRGRIVDETRNTFLFGDRAQGLAHSKECQPDHHPARRAEGEGRRLGLISQPENRISKRMQRTRWKL